MAEKDLSLTVLFDIYGGLLSDSEKDAFEYYYCDDLSLSEIAENTGWSRQGARDNIMRAEKALRSFEQRLGLKEKFDGIESDLSSIRAALLADDTERAILLIDSIKL